MTKAKGIQLDDQTRCAHWHSPVDIIAIKFACCNEYYACYDCHQALADHEPKRWPRESFDQEEAILCGACQKTMTITTYMNANSTCPQCGASFNSRCQLHWHLYFEV